MKECFRVLKPNGWMLLMFMNTSKDVWEALRNAITSAGFSVEKIDSFDKQHGTFKQFVNENAAGFDLVLHCRKQPLPQNGKSRDITDDATRSIVEFMASKGGAIPYIAYIHVERSDEVDYRQLYSEWLSIAMASSIAAVDFPFFRKVSGSCILSREEGHA